MRADACRSGHADAVLHVSFSPDGQMLASGGGDTLVRFYDAWTATPKNDCRGHKHHVLCTAWSPDGARFASGDKVGEIRWVVPGSYGARSRRHRRRVAHTQLNRVGAAGYGTHAPARRRASR